MEEKKPAQDKPESFQFTIGRMLSLFFVLAVLISVFRWLLINHPEMLYWLITAFSTMLPFIGAIVTLYAVSKHLPNRRQIQIWTTTLLLTPLVGMSLLLLLQTMRLGQPATPMGNATGPTGLKQMATADILSKRLPKQIDEPWVWRALQDRANAGELSPGEAKQAMDRLVESWHTQSGQNRRITWAEKFIETAIANRLLSGENILELVKAHAGPPTVVVPRLREDSEGMRINIGYGSHRDLKAAGVLLWEPEFYLDDTLIQPTVWNHHPSSYSAVHKEVVAAGDHSVKVVLNCALLDKDKMVGLNRYRLPRSSWPKAMHTWQEMVTVPVKVFSKDATIVEFVTDPKQSPAHNLRIERLVVQSHVSRGGEQSKKVVVKFSGNEGPLPYCFRVYVDDGSQEHQAGTILGFFGSDNEWVSGVQTEGVVSDLSDDVRKVDVVLRPDPETLEFESLAEKMWGKSLKFPNVPVERLDLEVTTND